MVAITASRNSILAGLIFVFGDGPVSEVSIFFGYRCCSCRLWSWDFFPLIAGYSPVASNSALLTCFCALIVLELYTLVSGI